MQRNNKSLEESADLSFNIPDSPAQESSESLEDRPTDVVPAVPRNGAPVDFAFSRLGAVIDACLIVGGLLAIFFLLPRSMKGDGGVRYQALITLLVEHRIPDMKYSLVGPFFSLPLVWIGRHLGHPVDWALVYNQILFGLSLLVSYLLLRNHINRAILRRFYLLLIIASMFVAHLAFFYGEVFTALCVGFGVLIVYLRFAAPAGWLVIAVGVANTPAALGALGMLLFKRIFDSKRLRSVLVFCAALAFIGLNDWLQRGNPFDGGYADDHGAVTIMPYSGLPGFSYPLFFGILSLLFSFGKGLFFFAPGLLLPVRKTLLRHKEENQLPLYQVYILWLAFVVGLVLVYARWWAWYGGVFWGPRFLLFASIPASFALAVRLLYCRESSLGVNLLTLVVFALSVWVCIDGAVYQWSTSLFNTMPAICTQNNFNLEMVCYFIPEFSQLWLPFVHHYALDTPKLLFMGYILLVAIYLGLPLCLQIGRQTIELLRKYSPIYLPLKEWRI
jgi:hypothetical protein